MSAKHTQAPWEVAGSGLTVWADHDMVADCSPAELEIPAAERQANARLIAAAPELLEALELIAAAEPYDYAECQRLARAAIARARGNP